MSFYLKGLAFHFSHLALRIYAGLRGERCEFDVTRYPVHERETPEVLMIVLSIIGTILVLMAVRLVRRAV